MVACICVGCEDRPYCTSVHSARWSLQSRHFWYSSVRMQQHNSYVGIGAQDYIDLELGGEAREQRQVWNGHACS